MSKFDKGAQTFLFKMLSNDVRIRILESLISDEKSVGELCTSVNEEQTRVSHELQRLRSCGLVHQRREGKMMIYAINDEKTVLSLLHAANNHAEKFGEQIKRSEVFSKPKRSIVNGIAV